MNVNSVGSIFNQGEHLRAHKRVHTGERLYECKQCGKCFSSAGNLRRHEKVHTRRDTRHMNRRASKRLLRQRDSGGSNRIDISSGVTNNQLTQRVSRNGSRVVNFQSATVETCNCWICQEEMRSEVLLLQHYQNHMRHVDEDEL